MIKASDLMNKFRQAFHENWGYIYGKTHEMWSEEKQEAYAKEYANDPDRANSVKYGGKWAGHWVTDCSGMFTYWFKQHGQTMYHGSNTMYKSYCNAKGRLIGGKREDGQELKPGTAVFTGTESKHGHVGLYIGDGWIIEAKGAQYGVVRSPISQNRWTYWGELKGVEFDEQGIDEGAYHEPDVKPMLKRGSKGAYVMLLQTKLVNHGYNLGICGIDGDFGQATEAAVKAFQSDSGLTADGIVGPKTWDALEKSPTSVFYTVTIPNLTKVQADAYVSQHPGATMEEERG